ncbi:MAG: hypothetical protein KBD24_00445 [Candidatus Pacebacteria bacterium]|nr:hypothetical protein [Candidatus Paceibacterota bacterium]
MLGHLENISGTESRSVLENEPMTPEELQLQCRLVFRYLFPHKDASDPSACEACDEVVVGFIVAHSLQLHVLLISARYDSDLLERLGSYAGSAGVVDVPHELVKIFETATLTKTTSQVLH